MDVPFGNSITRVSKTPKFGFPEYIDTLTIDLIPLLELVMKGKHAIMVNKRKKEKSRFY
jgi:hypothetical protein